VGNPLVIVGETTDPRATLRGGFCLTNIHIVCSIEVMPRATIWIRAKNWKRWKKLKNKSALINEMLEK